MSDTPTKPNFLYVGGSRAGSTWIHHVLREHPEVFVPAAKDIMFFDRYFDKGEDWYLSYFKEARGYSAVGELSHDYFLDPLYAQRIEAMLPETRIFCCLRETVDKTLSMYLYNRSTTPMFRSESAGAAEISFEEFAQLADVAKLVDYYHNLKPFYDRFGSQRVLVLLYDDMASDPRGFVRSLYDFLGVDAEFEPPSLTERINATRAARSTALAHLVYRGGQAARKLGLMNLVGNVKHSGWFERMLYKPAAAKPSVPDALRRQLQADFTRDFDKLEAMIGRTLPRSWYPDA